MDTLTATIPVDQIPAIKKAARELGVDFVDGNEVGDRKEVIFIISDAYQLIAIGAITVINTGFQRTQQKLNEIMDDVQQKYDSIIKKEPKDE